MKTKQAAARPRRAPRPSDADDIKALIAEVDDELGLRVEVPVHRPQLTDWRKDLDSALVLLQEVGDALENGNRSMDISSFLDGVHALVERVMGQVEEIENKGLVATNLSPRRGL